MIKYLFFLTILLFNHQAQAQTAEDSIRSSILQLFDAMRNADSVQLMDCFAPNAVLQTIVHTKTGEVKIKNEQIADFASFIQHEEKHAANEQIEFKEILIDADLASVWTPYRFYYKNKFSHCGVNSFQLVRINGLWKIQYLIDTRRKNGCSVEIK